MATRQDQFLLWLVLAGSHFLLRSLVVGCVQLGSSGIGTYRVNSISFRARGGAHQTDTFHLLHTGATRELFFFFHESTDCLLQQLEGWPLKVFLEGRKKDKTIILGLFVLKNVCNNKSRYFMEPHRTNQAFSLHTVTYTSNLIF